MKTNFTFPMIRTIFISFIFAISTIHLLAQTSHKVAVTAGNFTPKELTISAGDTVIWTNTQGSHNVNGTKTTFASNPESFGNTVGAGWTYKFVFNTAGTYDYQCDPHAAFGMVGKVIVNPKTTEPLKLTVNFTAMNPHVGQTLWLAVIDKATMMELGRVKATAAQNFSIEVPGIETGKSYLVDFFADHNKNGVYNAPPADHAWRRSLDNVTGNSVIDFVHNTTFTDIAWQNKLTVHFTAMTPHVGQKITLYVKQADTNVNVDTLMVGSVAGATFDLMSYKIMPGKSYKIDFYADHNKNGVYDAPPADHAWRIALNNVRGDSIVNFVHNTKFTNIFGPASHKIAVTAGNFTPKEQTILVGDTVIWTNTQGSHNVNGTQVTFAANPESFGNAVGAGWTYKFVFNTAGTYDYQCDPHAAFGMVGKIIVKPKLETGPFTLKVNFTAMNPHVGQTLWLAVIDKATSMEIGRVKTTAAQNFSIEVPGIETGKSYWVNFFADHNKNGVYNAPPADHAWQRSLDNVTGNSVIDFVHNTTFTNIEWKTKLTLRFTAMTPHVGQKLTLYVRDKSMMGMDMDVVTVPQTTGANFDVLSWAIMPGASYNIDFYADHNKNGVYNAPPADHAWRISLDNVKSDTIITFVHNTTFTDIFGTTATQKLADRLDRILLYPNPASQYIELRTPRNYEAISSLKVYSITGAIVDQKIISGNSEVLRYDVSRFKNGLYFIEINAGTKRDVLRFTKK